MLNCKVAGLAQRLESRIVADPAMSIKFSQATSLCRTTFGGVATRMVGRRTAPTIPTDSQHSLPYYNIRQLFPVLDQYHTRELPAPISHRTPQSGNSAEYWCDWSDVCGAAGEVVAGPTVGVSRGRKNAQAGGAGLLAVS